jgi:hypothetical protein
MSQSDGAEVTVFRLDKVSVPKQQQEAGQHGYQRIKAMRHPCILQYIDGVELEKELVMVTEPVKPLREWMRALRPGQMAQEQIVWGLRCLLSALEFLNCTQGLTHGALSAESVFVTRGGDWKLGGEQAEAISCFGARMCLKDAQPPLRWCCLGLDLLCEWKPEGRDIYHFQTHEGIVPQQYR